MGAPPLLSSFLTKLMAAAAAADAGRTIAPAATAGLGWWCVRLMCCGRSSTNFWQMGQRVTLSKRASSSNAAELLSGSSAWK